MSHHRFVVPDQRGLGLVGYLGPVLDLGLEIGPVPDLDLGPDLGLGLDLEIGPDLDLGLDLDLEIGPVLDHSDLATLGLAEIGRRADLAETSPCRQGCL